jgi:signal transduction histidine kinase
VIFNSLGSMRRLLKPTGDAAMLLDIVEEEADRLDRIVRDLLDFARPNEPALETERLDELLAGYGRDVDRDLVRGWWALRCLTAIRWLVEHDYDPFAPGCEAEVLRSLL